MGLRQDIIERTDGIPLFVEEMTKAVLEAGSEGEARRTAAAVPSLTTRSPQACTRRSWLDLTGSARPKKWHRLGQRLDESSPTPCWPRWRATLRRSWQSALDRLAAAGLLFRLGVPPYGTYLFKHALVPDAAYGTLLREPRRALHARIAETLETQFADVAETRPELLARHFAEAGLTEKAAGLWSKAGERSLARSALVEAVAQFTRALDQIAALPATPALRREQIKVQVGLANALMYTKGWAAAETKAAFDHAHTLMEKAEALGEPAEDPLLLYSVLYGSFLQKFIAFNGDAACTLARQFLALAEQQKATAPLMIGHRLLGNSLMSMSATSLKASPSGSRLSALRSGRASSAGDAIWPRRWSGDPEFSAIGSVDARLSRDCLRGSCPSIQRCARDGSRPNAIVCAVLWHVHPYLLPRLHGSEHANQTNASRWPRKKVPCTLR